MILSHKKDWRIGRGIPGINPLMALIVRLKRQAALCPARRNRVIEAPIVQVL
ncbi:MAG: hypothetical protein OEN02_16440 [Gammaproteobacteria bacterium]|nr:hypothetical protein [Gammaproteobacteria bacterium]MDH3534437.1 hypothetical protein [Gammaproteobacteria bacterium]